MKMRTYPLILAALFTVSLMPEFSLRADNTWDGGGASGSWSDLNNWGSDTTPVSPTALIFGGTSQLTNTNDLFTAGTQFNGITFNSDAGAFVIGGNAITLGGNIVNNSTSLQTINTNMATTAVRTVTLTTGGGNVALGGDISGTGGGITVGVVSNLSGTITLSGNNSYTGDTTLGTNVNQTITLVLGHKNALGTGTLKTNAGAILQASTDLSGSNKLSNNVLAALSVTASGSNSIEIGGSYTLNNAGNRALTNNISGGTLTLNDLFLNQNGTAGRVLTLDGTGTTIVKGVVANGGASHLLGIGGSATVTLENANTYTGGTNLSSATATLILGNKEALGAGTLNVTGNGTIQSSTDLVGANKIANNVLSTATTGPTFSGSNSLEIGGKYTTTATGSRSLTNNIAAGKVLVLNDVDINTDITAVRTLTIAGTGDTNITGVIANGNGSQANRITITNTGVTTLSGANTYTGITTLSAGMTVFANTSAKTAATATAAATASVGLGVGGSGYYTSGDVDSLFSNTLTGFSMNAASGVGIDTTAGDFTYATNQSAARSLTKLGANKLTLSGTNTYSGATNVRAGTLIIDGSVAGSGVIVSSGASLGGSGTVSSAVTVQNGGTLTPGNSPGLPIYSGGLTLETGSRFTFELIADTSAGRGTNFDGVDVTGGTFNLQSGVAFDIVLNLAGSTTDFNDVFWDSNQSWLVFDNTNAPTVASLFNLGTVSNDILGNSFSSTGGSLSFSQVGNDIYLNYTAAIPEPSTYAMILGGLGLLAILRRRMRS